MKFQTIKKDSEVFLNGVNVSIDRVDNSLRSITLTDDVGNVVKVQIASYSMEILVPAAPKMVEKFMLKGNVCGLIVNEQFDDKYSAENRKNEIESNTRSECELTIEKEMVAEQE